MARMPWFRFYPTEFATGVRGMTPQEVGVYTMLLCMIYEEGGPVPYNTLRLATYCGMRENTFSKVAEKLIALGKIVITDGMMMNPRAEREIASRANDLNAAISAGKASAEKRQQKQRDEATPVERPLNHIDKIREDKKESAREAHKTPLELLSEVASEQVARDFIDHRKGMKKPMTVQAAKAMANRLRNHGNPDAVLLLSIENGWQGVFPEKINAPVSIRPREGPWGGATIASLPLIPPPPKKVNSA